MKESVFDTLQMLAEWYFIISRALRNRYKWNPFTTDKLTIRQLSRIFDETIEDAKDGIDEEDFE